MLLWLIPKGISLSGDLGKLSRFGDWVRSRVFLEGRGGTLGASELSTIGCCVRVGRGGTNGVVIMSNSNRKDLHTGFCLAYKA